MGQPPHTSPGQSWPNLPSPGATSLQAPHRRRASRFRGKAWLLLTLPVGLTTWAAFLYLGIRGRRGRWLAWAGIYAATLAGWLALDTPANPSNAAKGFGAGLALATWIGGGVHAAAISNTAVRRIASRNDPAVTAAQERMERRAEGRRLLASKPALAKELGIGRPDLPGADDYGLVDVNHCPAQALVRLPGVTESLAARIVEARTQSGGFSSAEDLGLMLDLPPAAVDQIRDMAIFTPS